MKCPSCGAGLPEAASVCEYCHTAVPPRNDAVEGSLLQRVRQSPEFANALRSERRQRVACPGVRPYLLGAMAMAVASPLLWLGAVGMMALCDWLDRTQRQELLSYIPLLLGLVLWGLSWVCFLAVWLFIWWVLRARAGKIEALPVVVKRRYRRSRRGSDVLENGFVEVEVETSQAEEIPVWGEDCFQSLTENQTGILFLRGKLAVDFERVRIS